MRLVHAGLIVADLERAAQFYEGVLGLTRITRPALEFEGVWYGLTDGQQLHLMLLDNPYEGCEKPAHGGRDHHIALQSSDFDQMRTNLDEAGINYSMSRSGRKALFCRDPDGNTIELVG